MSQADPCGRACPSKSVAGQLADSPPFSAVCGPLKLKSGIFSSLETRVGCPDLSEGSQVPLERRLLRYTYVVAGDEPQPEGAPNEPKKMLPATVTVPVKALALPPPRIATP